MTGATRGLATVLVALASVPTWLAPGLEPPAAARQPTGTVEEVRHEELDGCTFKLVNNYSPGDERQYARTRQVWSEDCRFGSRNWTIRVKTCFKGSEGDPIECSPWLMPTSQEPYAESVLTGPVPKVSVHYVEIRDTAKRFDVDPPDLPPDPDPAPDPEAEPEPDSPPSPAPDPSPEAGEAASRRPTTPPAAEPGPSATSPAGGQAVEHGATSQPELRATASQHEDRRYGLAAGLAAGGAVLLGLGGAGVWLLRRGGSGSWLLRRGGPGSW